MNALLLSLALSNAWFHNGKPGGAPGPRVPPDSTAPVTTISSAPSGVTGITNATFVFSASESSTFVCTVDLGSAACTSPATFTGLDQGPHTFTVAATDLAGNPEVSPPSAAWIIYSNSKSILFTGDDDIVNIGKPADLDLTVGASKMTIGIWFKRGAASDFERHMGGKARMGAGGQVGIVLGQRSDEQVETLVYGGESTNGGNTGGFVHGWHLHSVSINGATAREYLDGLQVGSTFSVGAGPWETTADWLFGANRYNDNTDTGYPWSGNLDEITTWSDNFTDAQHVELFNSGTPTSPYAHSKSATLTHFYRMGDGDTYPTITDRKGSANGTAQNMSGSGVIVTDAPVGLSALTCDSSTTCTTHLVADDWDGSSGTWTDRQGYASATKRGSPVNAITPNFAGRKSILFSAAGACMTIPLDDLSTTTKRTYEILLDDWGTGNTAKYLAGRNETGGFTKFMILMYKATNASFESDAYNAAVGVYLGGSASMTNTEGKPIAWTIVIDMTAPSWTVYRNGTQIFQDLTTSGTLTSPQTGLALGLGCRWDQLIVSTEIFGGKVLEFLRHDDAMASGTVANRLTQFNSLKGY